jgi:hypothetical protein
MKFNSILGMANQLVNRLANWRAAYQMLKMVAIARKHGAAAKFPVTYTTDKAKQIYHTVSFHDS